MPATASPAVTLFYSYAHEDEPLRDELAGHLKILERRGLIRAWHDRQILAGEDWHQAIDHHLDSADLVLLLVSKDFVGSDYIFGVELERAQARCDRGDCEVVPILVRAVDIEPGDFWFMARQGLPPDLKPVTSWANRDEAWTQVAKGLRRTVEAIRARKPPPPPEPPPSPPSYSLPPAGAGAAPATRSGGGDMADGEVFLGGDVFGDGSVAGAPLAPPADPVLDGLVDRFVQQVDVAQQQRGGPPLYDHHRYLAAQEARALIDLSDPVRVLWVDDRPDNNLHERGLLAQLQIEVMCVLDTASALAQLTADAAAGEAFDLVISDWARPADGPDAALGLLAALQARGLGLPVLLYHGTFEPALRDQRARRAAAAGAYGETVLPGELIALVQRALSQRGVAVKAQASPPSATGGLVAGAG